MARFGSAGRLASWAGMCPGNNESAGKHFSGKTRKGSKWLRMALIESAKAASRTKDSYFAAQYARIKGRHSHQKATVPLHTRSLLWSIIYLKEASPTRSSAVITLASASRRMPTNGALSSNSNTWVTRSL